MPFSPVEDILRPDPRFNGQMILDGQLIRQMAIADHHGQIAEIDLEAVVPAEVRAAFDRARSVLLYAWFDYDLLVVGESQAFGAFELALKHRLFGPAGQHKGTLRNLIDQARKRQILPQLTTPFNGLIDPIEALLHLRNALAHGTNDIHAPAMALLVVKASADAINELFVAT